MKYSKSELHVILLDSFCGLEYKHKKILAESFAAATDFKSAVEQNERYIKSALGNNVYATMKNAGTDGYADAVCENLERKGITAVTCFSEDYSQKLLSTPLYPIVLYAKGDVSLLNERTFAMVGSRKSLPVAIGVARGFSKTISGAGFVLATGIAEGVDSTVLESVLDGNGKAISVVAGGLGRIYPAANAGLVDRLAERGLVIAEFPPEIRSERYMFPVRNRIIAGLSDGVLVVSAGKKSGTLYTAEYAEEYGRDLFAVPYGVGVDSGEGCNDLIKRGASLCDTPDDILDFYGVKNKEEKISLSPDETQIVNVLRDGERHIEEISKLTGKEVFVTAGVLSVLEIKGVVAKNGVNVYGLIRKS